MFYLQSEVEKKEDEIVDLSTTGFTYNDTHYDFAMKSSDLRVEYVFKNGESLLFLQQNGLYRHNFYIKLVDFKNNKIEYSDLTSNVINVSGKSLKIKKSNDPVFGKPVVIGDKVVKQSQCEYIYNIVFISDGAIVLERNGKLLTINKKDVCALTAYGLVYKG